MPKVPAAVEPPASVASVEVNSSLLTVVEPRPSPETPNVVTQVPDASNDPVLSEQDPSASAAEEKSKSESS
jgi:hypothetical protein